MSSKLAIGLLLSVVALTWFASDQPVAADPTVRPSAAYTHENLSVYILRGPETFDASNVLTLQEALERGVAVVHETGSVNTLAVENTSDTHEVFLQSGEIVKGGKQDRLIASDLLLPSKSGRVAVGANCCEQSRWTKRGGESDGKFDKSTDFVNGNAIRLANAGGQQSTVWREVTQAQVQLSENLGKAVTMNASPTSLQLALEDKDLTARVAAYEKSLGRLAAAYPDAVGVVIAVNGQVIAADVYGSNTLFRKLWPKLLKAASVDAIAHMPKDGAMAKAPGVNEVVKFLASQSAPEAVTEVRGPVMSNISAGSYGNRSHVLRNNSIDAINPALVDEAIRAMNAPSIPFETVDLPQTRNRTVAEHNGGTVELRNAAPLLVLNAWMNDNTIAAPAPSAGGVAVVETQAPSQPGKVIHRSILKK